MTVLQRCVEEGSPCNDPKGMGGHTNKPHPPPPDPPESPVTARAPLPLPQRQETTVLHVSSDG